MNDMEKVLCTFVHRHNNVQYQIEIHFTKFTSFYQNSPTAWITTDLLHPVIGRVSLEWSIVGKTLSFSRALATE